jgi:hypothetical protein
LALPLVGVAACYSVSICVRCYDGAAGTSTKLTHICCEYQIPAIFRPLVSEAKLEAHTNIIYVQFYACMVLIGKPEGKKPLRRPRHKWEDDGEMDLIG